MILIALSRLLAMGLAICGLFFSAFLFLGGIHLVFDAGQITFLDSTVFAFGALVLYLSFRLLRWGIEFF